MFYVKSQNGKAVSAQTEYPGNDEIRIKGLWSNRNDWKTFEAAEKVAAQLNEVEGYQRFIPTDAGPHCSPQYDICEIPKVGDKVSKSFNGDSYPEGEIVSISKSLKVIKTSTGLSFYRRRLTGALVNHDTWSLIPGHHFEQNPSF